MYFLIMSLSALMWVFFWFRRTLNSTLKGPWRILINRFIHENRMGKFSFCSRVIIRPFETWSTCRHPRLSVFFACSLLEACPSLVLSECGLDEWTPYKLQNSSGSWLLIGYPHASFTFRRRGLVSLSFSILQRSDATSTDNSIFLQLIPTTDQYGDAFCWGSRNLNFFNCFQKSTMQ